MVAALIRCACARTKKKEKKRTVTFLFPYKLALLELVKLHRECLVMGICCHQQSEKNMQFYA